MELEYPFTFNSTNLEDIPITVEVNNDGDECFFK